MTKSAAYQMYELEDPRQPNVPRWVGYGKGFTPWEALWDFREHGTGPLFDWLRDLDANGLTPVVSPMWRIGRVDGCRLSAREARNVARCRIHIICDAAGMTRKPGELYPDVPDFLFNRRLCQDDPRKPIVAERPDGQTWEFASVGHAVDHGFTRSAVYEAIKRGTPYQGLTWRYAGGAGGGRNRRPVERVTAWGEVTAFRSLYEAAKVTGVSRPQIARLIESGGTDRNGCRWRDAAE